MNATNADQSANSTTEHPKPVHPLKSIIEHALTPCVKIIVGPEGKQKVFHAHAGLLMEKSGFFKGCLSHGCVETSTNEVRLPEDNPLAVGLFIGWLYLGVTGLGPRKRMSARHLTRLYVLADKLICPQLMNQMMEEVRQFETETQADERDLLFLIDAGQGRSKLAQYLVWEVAGGYREKPESLINTARWLELMNKDPEMVKDVMERMRQLDMLLNFEEDYDLEAE